MKYTLPLAALVLLLLAGVALTQTTRNPHGKLDMACTDCHTTDSWTTMRADLAFDHNKTGFRLDGAHRAAPCGTCHRDLLFNHVGTACADCHADHHQGQLGSQCASCHTPRDWQPRGDILDKHAERGFPLTGAHAVADCEACHQKGDQVVYTGTASTCETCHLSRLADATDPDHSDAIFQGGCERCHHAGLGTWRNTAYQHPAGFPLTGAHRLARCGTCHPTSFAGTPNQCYDCHNAEYAASTEPNHVQSGFGTACKDCHSTTAWVPATFDHNATGFTLTGRHIGVACSACHATGYAGTATDCYACHQQAYEATTDPNHAAALFPTDCQNCHTTAAWQPSTWDHDATYFPIYSGAHRARWSSCNECHTVPSDFSQFDCTVCHEHGQQVMADKHSGVQNYQWLSSACYTCHPRGTH
jgi:hypothetical protein